MGAFTDATAELETAGMLRLAQEQAVAQAAEKLREAETRIEAARKQHATELIGVQERLRAAERVSATVEANLAVQQDTAAEALAALKSSSDEEQSLLAEINAVKVEKANAVAELAAELAGLKADSKEQTRMLQTKIGVVEAARESALTEAAANLATTTADNDEATRTLHAQLEAVATENANAAAERGAEKAADEARIRNLERVHVAAIAAGKEAAATEAAAQVEKLREADTHLEAVHKHHRSELDDARMQLNALRASGEVDAADAAERLSVAKQASVTMEAEVAARHDTLTKKRALSRAATAEAHSSALAALESAKDEGRALLTEIEAVKVEKASAVAELAAELEDLKTNSKEQTRMLQTKIGVVEAARESALAEAAVNRARALLGAAVKPCVQEEPMLAAPSVLEIEEGETHSMHNANTPSIIERERYVAELKGKREKEEEFARAYATPRKAREDRLHEDELARVRAEANAASDHDAADAAAKLNALEDAHACALADAKANAGEEASALRESKESVEREAAQRLRDTMQDHGESLRVEREARKAQETAHQREIVKLLIDQERAQNEVRNKAESDTARRLISQDASHSQAFAAAKSAARAELQAIQEEKDEAEKSAVDHLNATRHEHEQLLLTEREAALKIALKDREDAIASLRAHHEAATSVAREEGQTTQKVRLCALEENHARALADAKAAAEVALETAKEQAEKEASKRLVTAQEEHAAALETRSEAALLDHENAVASLKLQYDETAAAARDEAEHEAAARIAALEVEHVRVLANAKAAAKVEVQALQDANAMAEKDASNRLGTAQEEHAAALEKGREAALRDHTEEQEKLRSLHEREMNARRESATKRQDDLHRLQRERNVTEVAKADAASKAAVEVAVRETKEAHEQTLKEALRVANESHEQQLQTLGEIHLANSYDAASEAASAAKADGELAVEAAVEETVKAKAEEQKLAVAILKLQHDEAIVTARSESERDAMARVQALDEEHTRALGAAKAAADAELQALHNARAAAEKKANDRLDAAQREHEEVLQKERHGAVQDHEGAVASLQMKYSEESVAARDEAELEAAAMIAALEAEHAHVLVGAKAASESEVHALRAATDQAIRRAQEEHAVVLKKRHEAALLDQENAVASLQLQHDEASVAARDEAVHEAAATVAALEAEHAQSLDQAKVSANAEAQALHNARVLANANAALAAAEAAEAAEMAAKVAAELAAEVALKEGRLQNLQSRMESVCSSLEATETDMAAIKGDHANAQAAWASEKSTALSEYSQVLRKLSELQKAYDKARAANDRDSRRLNDLEEVSKTRYWGQYIKLERAFTRAQDDVREALQREQVLEAEKGQLVKAAVQREQEMGELERVRDAMQIDSASLENTTLELRQTAAKLELAHTARDDACRNLEHARSEMDVERKEAARIGSAGNVRVAALEDELDALQAAQHDTSIKHSQPLVPPDSDCPWTWLQNVCKEANSNEAARRGAVNMASETTKPQPDSPARDALVQLAMKGPDDAEECRVLLDWGIEVNFQQDGNQWTALHWAALQGHGNIVRLLLKDGMPAESVSGGGGGLVPPSRGQRRCDLNIAEAHYRCTALQFACMEGHVDIARMLLDAGADANARNSSESTALIVAAAQGCHDVVRLLVEDGEVRASAKVDVNVQDENGWTALQWALLSGHRDVALLLIAAGADVIHARGPPPLIEPEGTDECTVDGSRIMTNVPNDSGPAPLSRLGLGSTTDSASPAFDLSPDAGDANLRADRGFMLEVIKVNRDALRYCDAELLADPVFMAAAKEWCGGGAKHAETIGEIVHGQVGSNHRLAATTVLGGGVV
jgi:ankyrin repeat protein